MLWKGDQEGQRRVGAYSFVACLNRRFRGGAPLLLLIETPPAFGHLFTFFPCITVFFFAYLIPLWREKKREKLLLALLAIPTFACEGVRRRTGGGCSSDYMMSSVSKVEAELV